MKVNFLDLHAQYSSIKDEIDGAIQQVLEKCAFAAGPFVKSFEEHFAAAHQSAFCVGVNSGTAALHIVMMAHEIGPGDEVIVPANTFFATPEAVSLAGATPVFVDHEPDYYNIDPAQIERAITPRTKAIIAVNLYGQPAQLDQIKAIAAKHNILLLEDCAQSHLATLNGQSTGTFGVCGCFSFYPGKNLGAYGEGGAVITHDEALYKKMMSEEVQPRLLSIATDFILTNKVLTDFSPSDLPMLICLARQVERDSIKVATLPSDSFHAESILSSNKVDYAFYFIPDSEKIIQVFNDFKSGIWP